MDKIKKRKRERINNDIWIEAHWSIDDVANKVNKLVEGYNEIIKNYTELGARIDSI